MCKWRRRGCGCKDATRCASTCVSPDGTVLPGCRVRRPGRMAHVPAMAACATAGSRWRRFDLRGGFDSSLAPKRGRRVRSKFDSAENAGRGEGGGGASGGCAGGTGASRTYSDAANSREPATHRNAQRYPARLLCQPGAAARLRNAATITEWSQPSRQHAATDRQPETRAAGARQSPQRVCDGYNGHRGLVRPALRHSRRGRQPQRRRHRSVTRGWHEHAVETDLPSVCPGIQHYPAHGHAVRASTHGLLPPAVAGRLTWQGLQSRRFLAILPASGARPPRQPAPSPVFVRLPASVLAQLSPCVPKPFRVARKGSKAGRPRAWRYGDRIPACITGTDQWHGLDTAAGASRRYAGLCVPARARPEIWSWRGGHTAVAAAFAGHVHGAPVPVAAVSSVFVPDADGSFGADAECACTRSSFAHSIGTLPTAAAALSTGRHKSSQCAQVPYAKYTNRRQGYSRTDARRAGQGGTSQSHFKLLVLLQGFGVPETLLPLFRGVRNLWAEVYMCKLSQPGKYRQRYHERTTSGFAARSTCVRSQDQMHHWRRPEPSDGRRNHRGRCPRACQRMQLPARLCEEILRVQRGRRCVWATLHMFRSERLYEWQARQRAQAGMGQQSRVRSTRQLDRSRTTDTEIQVERSNAASRGHAERGQCALAAGHFAAAAPTSRSCTRHPDWRIRAKRISCTPRGSEVTRARRPREHRRERRPTEQHLCFRRPADAKQHRRFQTCRLSLCGVIFASVLAAATTTRSQSERATRAWGCG